MKTSELMSTSVATCSPDDTTQRAAQLMWEHDCGVVPVVDGQGHVVGMITDRDICMAAFTQSRPLWEIPVSSAMARQITSVREDEGLDTAEALMQRIQIRRLPVVDGDGHLKGILSLNDIARHFHPGAGRKSDGLSSDVVIKTLAAICTPPVTASRTEPATPSPLSS
jgi:CBS domain-containing protein